MEVYFQIPCPENILWWIICIAIIGTLITGVVMLQSARFALTREGVPVSTQRFHRSWRAGKAAETLEDMSANARASMRHGIKTDYVFAIFFYGLMICLSILALRNSGMEGWREILIALCWLPVLTFLFDLLEDTAALSVLSAYERKRETAPVSVLLMTIFSLLKWASGIAWLVIMISLGITESVAAF